MNGPVPTTPLSDDLRPLLLIIDDDGAVRESLAMVMEAFGFRTRTAGDGVEGLKAIANEPPSAIITDLQMPGMGGFDLLKALRAESRIPVIAMSGGDTCDMDAAREMGAAAAFQKPLPIFDMVDAVSSLTARAA